MTRHALVAAALLAAALPGPLAAQAVMPEPAYCAFFYPNANCQNKGPGNPYTDPNYHRTGSAPPNENAAGVQPRRTHHRTRKHAS
jgi:hypothetical protein